ncbi:hypothetical protein [Herbaspirillum sp. NPDC087042]|uniref:hypothetical protein n=1 Tax=Herbaspirillum sp. NPDC087042 TaxID=3364004 RepID=UPI0038048416
MECFYEPNYVSGKAQRWAIGIADGEPFCVAGLWCGWKEEEDGLTSRSRKSPSTRTRIL